MAERGRYHPSRWRGLTWFIVYVDAFGVAFFVGLVIGYRLVSPLGSDAEEGVAMLLYLTVALVLLFGAGIILNRIGTPPVRAYRRVHDSGAAPTTQLAPDRDPRGV